MRVALVSTYPPTRCGIGVYTRDLARALVDVAGDLRILVAAERGAGAVDDARLAVRPCYGRRDDYRGALAECVRDAEVVHVQYAPDLFGEDLRLPGLLDALHVAGKRTVVTLHTVYGPRRARWLALRPSTRAFYRDLAGGCDLIVVHHKAGMADRLVDQGIPEAKLRVIPHGTSLMSLPDHGRSRRALGLSEEAFVLLFFGFVHVQKNVHTVLEAFIRTARRAPEAVLVIAGRPWQDRWYNRLYLDLLRRRARASGLGGRIVVRAEYVDPEDVPLLFAAADLVLLPHWQRYGSASGVLHQAIGAGKPVMCARGPKFEDALRLLDPRSCPAAHDVAGWARAMAWMIGDPEARARGQEAVAGYAARTMWPKVAADHAAMYRELALGQASG